MARVTIRIPDELEDEVKEGLTYGDSFSAEVRDALRHYLDAGRPKQGEA